MLSNRVPKSCATTRGVHLSVAGTTPVIGPDKLGRQPMTSHMTSNTSGLLLFISETQSHRAAQWTVRRSTTRATRGLSVTLVTRKGEDARKALHSSLTYMADAPFKTRDRSRSSLSAKRCAVLLHGLRFRRANLLHGKQAVGDFF